VQQVGQSFILTSNGRNQTHIAVSQTAVQQGWGLLELKETAVSLETIFLNKLKEAETAGHIATEEEE
jgi:hypothetical protein